VGYTQAPFAEQTTIQGGKQSMPLAWNNTAGVAFSEAIRTFSPARNWSASRVAVLTLYFCGSTTNKTNEPFYVKLTDQSNKSGKVVYGAAAGEAVANLALASWNQWKIPLSGFGVNLAQVKSITIGLGTPGGASSGNTGIVYIDDIQLTKAQ
jgi:hypothetical protein